MLSPVQIGLSTRSTHSEQASCRARRSGEKCSVKASSGSVARHSWLVEYPGASGSRTGCEHAQLDQLRPELFRAFEADGPEAQAGGGLGVAGHVVDVHGRRRIELEPLGGPSPDLRVRLPDPLIAGHDDALEPVEERE